MKRNDGIKIHIGIQEVDLYEWLCRSETMKYGTRVSSPLFSLTDFLLFRFCQNQNQQTNNGNGNEIKIK